MNGRQAQSGYGVMLVLLVMMTGSAAVLAPLLPTHSGVSHSSLPTVDAEMQFVRQSLLAYATVYPFLYGPRGAGPGHFPCPDVSGADGPDPPCGRQTVAKGRLPRHVSLPGRRHAFQSDVSQRYSYIVDSDLINNPVNRVVNDEVLENRVEAQPILARVGTEVHPLQSGSRISLPLTARSMIPGIRNVVAAWTVQRVNRLVGQDCIVQPVRTHAEEVVVQERQLIELIADRTEQGSLACINEQSADSSEEDYLIEGVPASSHWFIRNRWHERISVVPVDGLIGTSEIHFR